MSPTELEQTLDPDDWSEAAGVFHQAADLCLRFLQTARERPVWQPVPEEVTQKLRQPVPHKGHSLTQLLSFFQQDILPYGTGNTHPRFWGWVHGSGTVAGALGEMLAAFMNCNVGGRDHVGVTVERQVVQWCREIFGFPAFASGLLTSGTSMGTLIALAVARSVHAGADVQAVGLAGLPKRLVGYTSREAHGCIAKTFELLGLGRESLRLVPVDAEFRMDTAHLARMVMEDREAGLQPITVIASAGTVNTGAIDDLDTMADFCREQNLWLHVDAAFGGLAVLTEEFRERLAPLARADSVAFDFHKWLHVPYDAGCVLIKDEAAHRQTFSSRREYLSSLPRGLAGGDPWYCEYGPELSRGFRALKVWFTLQAYGLRRLGDGIAQNCRQARALGALVQAHPALELLAPVTMNIVCFRFAAPPLSPAEQDALNSDIVVELQMQGIAAPSTTRIGGQTAIRVALTNHRTQTADLELLAREVVRLGLNLGQERLP